MTRLTVEEAVGILSILGCDNDSVVFRGQEMDLTDLAYSGEIPEVASKVRIRYYGYRGKGLKKGTLQSMVKDRLRV